MKAPEFMRIGGYFGDTIEFENLKKGDHVFISFGRYRQRTTRYYIVDIHKDKNNVRAIELARHMKVPDKDTLTRS
jgi:hypothetical protein